MRCKIIPLVFVFLFVCLLGPHYGAAQENSNKADEEQKQKETVVEEKAQQQFPPQHINKHKEVWPQPFQPTETVSADAAISFPTDI